MPATPSASFIPGTCETDFKPPEACVKSTISAVKALLAATKEERRRRGKYHKYSPELQEHMAVYAVKHGNQQAVKYFSERLETVVSDSTIRNIIKSHFAFTPLLKDEIGRFAANFGVESAARYFSERLKRDVPHSLVRKFKAIHLKKLPIISKRQKDQNPNRDLTKKFLTKKVDGLNSNKVRRYNNKIKEEIGFYACQHSITDTAKHFSEKLQMIIKERTVKRFHKAYLEEYQLRSHPTGNQELLANVHHLTDPVTSVTGSDPTVTGSINFEIQPSHQPQSQPVSIYAATPFHQQLPTAVTTTTACLSPSRLPLPLPLYPLNPCSTDSNCYQAPTSSVIMTQTSSGSFHYQSINPVQNCQTTQPFSSHQTVTTVSHQPQPVQSSFVMAHQPLIVSNEPDSLNISTHFMVAPPVSNPPAEIPQRPLVEKNVLKTDNDENNIQVFIAVKCDNESNNSSLNSDNHSSLATTVDVSDIATSSRKIETSVYPSEKEIIVGDNEEKPLLKRLKRKSKEQEFKKNEENKKRGNYTFYSPELRAEMGKYAAEHSSIKACQHFSILLGHDVPESTVRGLRKRYLQKKIHCNVTSLGYSQRGRPLRLGKYDEVVQECLKELVRHGEKVTSYLAITTAKLILNKYEPGLLEENGGSVKLNITWAKSFLKRIGVHNNS